MFGKTALGIDISDGRINMALLKMGKGGIRLLKTATAPIPQGAISNGNVADAAAIAKTIKKLKSRNRIHEHCSVLSLATDPVLIQILELPRHIQGNVGQFVRDEVKNYVLLPRQKTAIDFCGINASARSTHHQLLVVATDSDKVDDLAEVVTQAGLQSSIKAIEPAVPAYIRACYAKKIAGRFDRNLLFAIIHEGTCTFCLFRNQILQFIRSRRPDPDVCDRCMLESEACSRCIADEIHAIIQFYELQSPEETGTWEVTVVTELSQESALRQAETLRAGVPGIDLDVVRMADAYMDTPVAASGQESRPSAIAVGLAMKFLNLPGNDLNVNLLPAKVVEAKAAGRQTAMIGCVAAIIFTVMIFAVGFLSLKEKRQQQHLQQQKQSQLNLRIQALKEEKLELERKTAGLAANLDQMNQTLNTALFVKWGMILQDISSAIPKTVQITSLRSEGNMRLLLGGQALSYGAVHLFVQKLHESEHIRSATPLGTQRDSGSSYLVKYDISCSLVE